MCYECISCCCVPTSSNWTHRSWTLSHTLRTASIVCNCLCHFLRSSANEAAAIVPSKLCSEVCNEAMQYACITTLIFTERHFRTKNRYVYIYDLCGSISLYNKPCDSSLYVWHCCLFGIDTNVFSWYWSTLYCIFTWWPSKASNIPPVLQSRGTFPVTCLGVEVMVTDVWPPAPVWEGPRLIPEVTLADGARDLGVVLDTSIPSSEMVFRQ